MSANLKNRRSVIGAKTSQSAPPRPGRSAWNAGRPSVTGLRSGSDPHRDEAQHEHGDDSQLQHHQQVLQHVRALETAVSLPGAIPPEGKRSIDHRAEATAILGSLRRPLGSAREMPI
jgi:hypothetical protein